jgi:hypothetical protein
LIIILQHGKPTVLEEKNTKVFFSNYAKTARVPFFLRPSAFPFLMNIIKSAFGGRQNLTK